MLKQIGMDGTLRKVPTSEAFGPFQQDALPVVRDLLATIQKEADPLTVSQLILTSYTIKHGKPIRREEDDDDEGHGLNLESGDESGLDD